jgi:hypothetical protein
MTPKKSESRNENELEYESFLESHLMGLIYVINSLRLLNLNFEKRSRKMIELKSEMHGKISLEKENKKIILENKRNLCLHLLIMYLVIILMNFESNFLIGKVGVTGSGKQMTEQPTFNPSSVERIKKAKIDKP